MQTNDTAVDSSNEYLVTMWQEFLFVCFVILFGFQVPGISEGHSHYLDPKLAYTGRILFCWLCYEFMAGQQVRFHQ